MSALDGITDFDRADDALAEDREFERTLDRVQRHTSYCGGEGCELLAGHFGTCWPGPEEAA